MENKNSSKKKSCKKLNSYLHDLLEKKIEALKYKRNLS